MKNAIFFPAKDHYEEIENRTAGYINPWYAHLWDRGQPSGYLEQDIVKLG